MHVIPILLATLPLAAAAAAMAASSGQSHTPRLPWMDLRESPIADLIFSKEAP